MLFRAQFYGEDGTVWFHDAYSSGWAHALFLPCNGYVQLLPRLVAGLALLVPFQFAPLVMNVVGIAMQALVVNVMLSGVAADWAPFRLRVLWTCAYVALPNSSELHATITEGQWHLALLGCILAVSPPPHEQARFEDCRRLSHRAVRSYWPFLSGAAAAGRLSVLVPARIAV